MRLFSSTESVARGEPSWLALLETLWATIFYWGMAWYGQTDWPVIIPLGVAPLLLLRSPESTLRGARWFAAYLANKANITPLGTPIRFWGIMLPVVVGVTTLCTSLLADILLPNYTHWDLFLRALLVGMVAMWVAMAVAVAGGMEGAVVVALTVAFALAVGAARAGVAELAFAWALAVTLVAIAAAIVAMMWLGAVAGEGELAIAIILAGIPWIVGVWLRSLGVRLVATLRHPWRGLCTMPENWRRIVWVLDSRHPPELVPGLMVQTPALSWPEIQTIIRSHGIMRKLFGLLAFFCFFLPAILYRWSLKSTIWLYWPLLYLESLPQGQDWSEADGWRLALRSGYWERLRRWLSLWMVGVALFLLLNPPSFLATLWDHPLITWERRMAWQASALTMILLTLAIQWASRSARLFVWLRGLVWLRNVCGILLLIWTVFLAYFIWMFQV